MDSQLRKTHSQEAPINVAETSDVTVKARFLIVGAGGFGREVLMVYRSLENDAVAEQYRFQGFLDDVHEHDHQVFSAIDAEVVGGLDSLMPTDGYVISVANPHVKSKVHRRVATVGAEALVLVHPTAWMGDDIELGPGTIVTAQCSLTTNIRLGQHVHVNLGCTLGHDSRLEDYVTLSPGVHVSGNVHIEEGVLIGTGAVLLPGITIGRGAVIGAGAVVTKDVPSGMVAVGMPAKPLKAVEPFRLGVEMSDISNTPSATSTKPK